MGDRARRCVMISAAGKHLGRSDREATANCAWGDDGSTLYMTATCRLPRQDEN